MQLWVVNIITRHCWSLSWIILLLLTLLSICFAKELSIYEFDSLLKDRKYLFVYFYSQGCDECSRTLFTWELLEKRILSLGETKLLIGQVDCTIHKELCLREKVFHYPTIRLYNHEIGQEEDRPTLVYHSNDNSNIKSSSEKEKFLIFEQTDTDLPSLELFLRDRLPRSTVKGLIPEYYNRHSDDDTHWKLINKDQVIHWVLKGFYELTDNDYELFLVAKGENLVYFYTPFCEICRKLEEQWRQVIKSLPLKSVRFSRVDCAHNPGACSVYLVKDFPTLLWISNGRIKQRFKNLQHHSVDEFVAITKRLVELIEDPSKHNQMKVNLNSEDFRLFINTGLYFVHFTVPWSKHCTEMEPEWDALVSMTKSMKNVKIAQVDCSVNERICDIEELEGYPTLYLYKDGVRIAEYEGERNAEAFMKYLRQIEAELSVKEEL